MNLSLSKGGLPASVKNRAWQYCQMAWRGVTSKKALSRLAALSPLLLLGVGQMANATDLLAGGKDDVKATFGADSFVMMCIIIAELIVGVAMYIRTKNLLILLGLVVVTAPDGADACLSAGRFDGRPAGGHADSAGKHRPLYGHSGVCRGGENHPVPGGDGCPEHPV